MQVNTKLPRPGATLLYPRSVASSLHRIYLSGWFCATHQKRGQSHNPLQSWAAAPNENEETKTAAAAILAEEIITDSPVSRMWRQFVLKPFQNVSEALHPPQGQRRRVIAGG